MRFLLTVSALVAMAVLTPAGQPGAAVASPEGVGEATAANPATTPPAGTLNPRLVKADQVAGTILDVSPTRILFLTRSVPPILRSKDRVTKAFTDVPSPLGQQPYYGWLAPRGVVLTPIPAPGSNERRLYQWIGKGGPIDLGPLDNQYSPVLVRGSYLAWHHNFTLVRRNLDTLATVVVTTAGAGLGDMTPTGDIVYFVATPGEGRFQIARYHNGHTELVPDDDPARSDRVPVTDGVDRRLPRFRTHLHDPDRPDGVGPRTVPYG